MLLANFHTAHTWTRIHLEINSSARKIPLGGKTDKGIPSLWCSTSECMKRKARADAILALAMSERNSAVTYMLYLKKEK